MAKRITITDEKELQRIHELYEDMSIERFRELIFYLDACVLEDLVEMYPDVLERLLKDGNFRISRVAFDESSYWVREKARFHFWPKHRQKELQGVKAKLKAALDKIDHDWHDNIEDVAPGELYKELRLLEPLLSKTITYELFLQNWNTIYETIMKVGRDNIRADLFAEKLAGSTKKSFENVWAEKLKQFRTEHKMEIDKDLLPADFDDIIAEHRNLILRRILIFVLGQMKEYGRERTRDELVDHFRHEIDNDCRVLEHYLLAPHPKHFPTHDMDLKELAILHRAMRKIK